MITEMKIILNIFVDTIVFKTTTDLSNIKSFNMVELKPNYTPKFITNCNELSVYLNIPTTSVGFKRMVSKSRTNCYQEEIET